ncbi:MAG: hypothetical protein ACREF3_01370 [Acetobacteraceae bacterium]
MDAVCGGLYHGVHPPMIQDDVPVLTVPAYRGDLRRLPHARRRAFLRHLRRIIREAREPAPSLPPAQPEPAIGLRQITCAACGGHCCSRGAEHAYLADISIRRVAASHPGLRARAIARLYRDHLPEVSFAGSCVFHTALGCALPRALRADLCNSFYCNPLRRFIRKHGDAAPAVQRIVSRKGAD